MPLQTLPKHQDYLSPESVMREREALDKYRADYGNIMVSDIPRIADELGLSTIDFARYITS